MKQYTLEELNTIGTEFDLTNIEIRNWRAAQWSLNDKNNSTSRIPPQKYYIKDKIKQFSGLDYIQFEDKSYDRNNYFCVSLDELRKHNLIKEENLENQKIEVGDTVEVFIHLKHRHHMNADNGTTFIVSKVESSELDAIKWISRGIGDFTSIKNVKLIKKRNKNMNKEIIGYKLKDQKHNKAAAKIDGYISFGNGNAHEIELLLKDSDHSKTIQKFKDIDLLDLWFTPIYTKSKEIIKLNSDSGIFELEVSKEGIFYKKENQWLNIPDLEYLLANKTVKNGLLHKSTSERDYNSGYTIEVKTVDIGCQKNLKMEEIDNLMKTYLQIKNG